MSGQGTTAATTWSSGPARRVKGTVRAGPATCRWPTRGSPWSTRRATTSPSATTGPDGEYAFADLDTGEYTVTASGYPPVAAALTVGQTGPEAFGLTLSHPDE